MCQPFYGEKYQTVEHVTDQNSLTELVISALEKRKSREAGFSSRMTQ